MFYYKRIKIYLCGYFEHNRSDLKFLCWRIFVNAGKRILSRKGSVKATPIRIGTVIVPSVKIHFWTDYFITQLDKTPFELPQTGVMCMRSKLGRPVEFPWSLCLHSSNKPRFLWAAKGTLRGDFEFSFASKLKLTLQRKKSFYSILWLRRTQYTAVCHDCMKHNKTNSHFLWRTFSSLNYV